MNLDRRGAGRQPRALGLKHDLAARGEHARNNAIGSLTRCKIPKHNATSRPVDGPIREPP